MKIVSEYYLILWFWCSRWAVVLQPKRPAGSRLFLSWKVRRTLHDEQDSDRKLAELTGRRFAACGKACGCRTAGRRLEIAHGPLEPHRLQRHQNNATSEPGCCSTELCSDPCSGDLYGSVEEKEFVSMRMRITPWNKKTSSFLFSWSIL